MPSGPIQFGPMLASGDEQVAGASPNCVNVLVDGTGAVRRRPGITTSTSVRGIGYGGNPINGIHRTVGGDTFVSSTNGTVNTIYKSGVVGGASNATIGNMSGTVRPTFAETEAILALASGWYPKKIVFSGYAMSDIADSPAQASHIIMNGSRLLANKSVTFTSQIQYSDFAAGSSYTGHETWQSGASGYFSAEARADPVVALHENTNEVFCFGKTNLQVFTPDQTYDYAPVSTREYGCSAPYSIIGVDANFAWLDHRRRFIVSDGRTSQDISEPIASSLDELATISDCYGFRVAEGQYDILVWTFPTAGITYAYQVGRGWSVWSSYDGTSWGAMNINAHFYCTDGSGENLVGTTTGGLLSLSSTAYTDQGDPVQAYMETGFINRGTDMKKRCRCVRLALKRGVSQTTTELSMQLRYRDDTGAWSDPIDIGMGAAGDTDPIVEIRSLGVYRRRQWAFNFQGDENFVLAGATEEYDVLGM